MDVCGLTSLVFVAAFYCYIDTLRKPKEDSSDSESDEQMNEGLDKKVSTNIVNFDLANGCFLMFNRLLWSFHVYMVNF